jgi:hypothetical protein
MKFQFFRKPQVDDNHGTSMKTNITSIIAGTVCTMLVGTSFVLPALASNVSPSLHSHKPIKLHIPPVGQPGHHIDFSGELEGHLHVESAGPMRNALRFPLNREQQRAATFLIATLSFDQLQGNARSHIVPDRGGIRIDRQGQSSNGEQNIQVQVNGVNGNSTVATVLIPDRYLGNNLRPESRREVERLVRHALYRSLGDFESNDPKIYRLAGRLSNASN